MTAAGRGGGGAWRWHGVIWVKKIGGDESGTSRSTRLYGWCKWGWPEFIPVAGIWFGGGGEGGAGETRKREREVGEVCVCLCVL